MADGGVDIEDDEPALDLTAQRSYDRVMYSDSDEDVARAAARIARAARRDAIAVRILERQYPGTRWGRADHRPEQDRIAQLIARLLPRPEG
jgi:hypothetical protein